MSSSNISAAEAAELLKRRHLRKDLLSFSEHILAQMGQKPAIHHRLVIDKLQKVADGEIRKLMIFMPPGSAKSEYVSRIHPAWYLAHKPRGKIIAASHTIGLATQFGRKVRNLISENSPTLGYSLSSDNAAAGEFAINLGGEYFAAGVGTALPGRRASMFIIDDPVKGREAAESMVDREAVWNWYLSSALTRQGTEPMGLVICMTRYHEDDLCGRLLDSERDAWEVVSLPAQAEEDDILGRAPGECLWPESDFARMLEISHGMAKTVSGRAFISNVQHHRQVPYSRSPTSRKFLPRIFRTARWCELGTLRAPARRAPEIQTGQLG
jgi:hypothetical protein